MIDPIIVEVTTGVNDSTPVKFISTQQLAHLQAIKEAAMELIACRQRFEKAYKRLEIVMSRD
jgi:hypothetical protein